VKVSRGLLLFGWAAALLAGAAESVAAQPGTAGGAEVKMVQVAEAQLDLKVTASCDGKVAIFQIVNAGDRWPGAGAIKIVRAVDKSTISQRSIRMAASQQATFRVSERMNPGDEVGLFVEPTWYQRAMTFDATVSCP